MNQLTKIVILLLSLVTISIVSSLYMPNSFETDGGSCYQGITASIIRFLIKVCGTLSFISLFVIYYGWKKTAKILSSISFVIWFLFSLLFISRFFGYFLPFSLITILIAIYNFKMLQVQKESL